MIVITGDVHTKLLLHGDSFIDGSKDKRAITNTKVVVSTAQSKFGDSSFYFDGSAYLTIPGYDFSTDNFTIDWWEYPTNANAGTRFTNVYCTAYATQAGGLLTHLYTSSNLQVYLSNKTGGANASDWNVLAGNAIGNNIVNTWTHRAVVRSGSSLMFFKNGLLEHTYNIGTNRIGYSSDRPWGIGNWASDLMTTGYPYIGYIDEFRVSDIARWTESFTPPTEPYPDGNIEILPGGVISKEWALRRRMMMRKKATYLVTITGVGWHQWYGGNVYTMATVTINGTAYNAAPPEPIQVYEGDIITLQVYRGSLYGAAHIIIDGTTVVDGAGAYDYKVQSDVAITLSKQASTANDYGGQISLTTV